MKSIIDSQRANLIHILVRDMFLVRGTVYKSQKPLGHVLSPWQLQMQFKRQATSEEEKKHLHCTRFERGHMNYV